MPEVSILALRAATWLTPSLAIAATLALRSPDRRAGAAAIAATCWCLPALLVLNEAASRAGWWSFAGDGGVIAGMPVETWLGWAIAWGALPALLLSRIRIAPIVAAVGVWDFVAMPRLAPLVALGDRWGVGELAALLFVLAPALWLVRLTLEERAASTRAALQCVAFSGCIGWMVPTIALEFEGSSLVATLAVRGVPSPLLLALVGPFLTLALAGVAEFAIRGRGTPLPLDPPRLLVTTGPYAFVRNPMQLGASVLLGLEAAWLQSAWLALAVPISIAYSIGLAAFDESVDLRDRFGDEAERHRRAVRSWIPRWRPHREADAILYVGVGCKICEEFARLVALLEPSHLAFVPAQRHPARALVRLTYADGDYEVEGVRAVARALEHAALPFALIGFTMRAPGVATVLQWIADVSGAGPRELPPIAAS